MHYLFSNIKYLLHKENRSEEAFYTGLGFVHETIFDLVTGATAPSPEQLVLISDALGHSVDALLRNNLGAVANLAGTMRMLVVDVDGVLTDGGMYYTDSGLEIKKYNAKDGLALMRLAKNGIVTGMLSHGFNRTLIKTRAEMLGVPYYYTGQDRKEEIIVQWSEKAGIPLREIAYIGDDLNDLAVMKKVGFTAAPSDAALKVKQQVSFVTRAKGGEGCVREVAEILFPDLFV